MSICSMHEKMGVSVSAARRDVRCDLFYGTRTMGNPIRFDFGVIREHVTQIEFQVMDSGEILVTASGTDDGSDGYAQLSYTITHNDANRLREFLNIWHKEV